MSRIYNLACEITKWTGLYYLIHWFLRLKKKISVRITYILFGNANTLKNNLCSTHYLKTVRARMKETPSDSHPALAEKFKKNDVLYIPDYFSTSMIDPYRDKFLHLLNDEKEVSSELLDDFGNKVHRALKDVRINFPEAKDFFTKEIQDIICDYYGTHFKIDLIRAWRNYPVDERAQSKEAYSNFWHHDPNITCLIKYFVFLSDVSEDCGPLHALAKNDTRAAIKAGYYSRSDYLKLIPLLEDPKRKIRVTGKRGTIAFCNPQTILHRAGIPSSQGNYRDCLQFSILPSHTPFNVNFGESGSLTDMEELAYAKIQRWRGHFKRLPESYDQYSLGEILGNHSSSGLMKVFEDGIIFAFSRHGQDAQRIPFSRIKHFNISKHKQRCRVNLEIIQQIADTVYFDWVVLSQLYLYIDDQRFMIQLDYTKSFRVSENRCFLSTLAKQYLANRNAMPMSLSA